MNRKTMIITIMALFFSCTAFAVESEQAAPDFTVKTLDGKNLRLEEQKGNVVMVNFWASWCGPCRKEMPLIEKIQKKYSRLGFTVIGMNVDEDTAAAQRFLKDVETSFPIGLDPKGEVSKMYKVAAMPTTVMIDRNGKVRNIHKGYKAGDEKAYEKMIKKLIRE